MIATSASTDSRVSTPHSYQFLPIPATNMLPDGYISFPDFEKFCQSESPYGQQEQQSDVKA